MRERIRHPQRNQVSKIAWNSGLSDFVGDEMAWRSFGNNFNFQGEGQIAAARSAEFRQQIRDIQTGADV